MAYNGWCDSPRVDTIKELYANSTYDGLKLGLTFLHKYGILVFVLCPVILI